MTWTRAVLLSVLLAGGCVPGAGRSGAPAPATASSAAATAQAVGRTVVYVGLAGGEVVTFHLDPDSGALSRRGTTDVGRAPASLVRSTERETLVAVDEATGMAVAMAIDAKSGALSPVGRVPAGGAAPTGAVVDATGKYLLAAHAGAGTVSVLAIKPDGSLGAIDSFPAGAGASAVALHPANEIAFVANQRAGTITQFKFNTGTGMLTRKAGPDLALPKGSGPTRFACHPSGRWVYVIDEASDSVSVHAFDVDLKGLSPIPEQLVSTLPDGAARAKSKPVDLAVGASGRFLYVTNRGHDSVATFAIEAGGTLKLVGHEPAGGRAPGALAVDPSGAYLVVANEGSKTLSVFRLDPTTGAPGARRNVSLPSAPLSVLAAKL